LKKDHQKECQESQRYKKRTLNHKKEILDGQSIRRSPGKHQEHQSSKGLTLSSSSRKELRRPQSPSSFKEGFYTRSILGKLTIIIIRKGRPQEPYLHSKKDHTLKHLEVSTSKGGS